MPKNYLQHTAIIDWQHPTLIELSRAILAESRSQTEYIHKAFLFVRDQINHSWDFKRNPVTCTASDVLKHATGYCYAKSHLLAALLRAQQIPAGFCYQRLSIDGTGPPHSLHGLNAVFLEQFGWYRIDPRGNKLGVNAEFTPPTECLAFTIGNELERDLPEIWPDPLPVVIEALTAHTTVEELYENLPDIELLR